MPSCKDAGATFTQYPYTERGDTYYKLCAVVEGDFDRDEAGRSVLNLTGPAEFIDRYGK